MTGAFFTRHSGLLREAAGDADSLAWALDATQADATQADATQVDTTRADADLRRAHGGCCLSVGTRHEP
ncbi:MAG: hypothetical protein ACK4GC_09725 [Paracoccaceae bacterium]